MTKLKHSNRGSILVGVMVLGVVLTLAGGAMLLLAGHSANSITDMEVNARKKTAAESGLRLALGWVLKDSPAFPANFATTLNGEQVSVVITYVAGDSMVTSRVEPKSGSENAVVSSCKITRSLSYPPLPVGMCTYQCRTYSE